MTYTLHYTKAQVLQALRYHFIKQSEIKVLMIVVNIYAIVTAVLLFMKKIRPEPFLLGSLLWIVLMLFFWYILPTTFYKKTALFKYNWQFSFTATGANLQVQEGEASWNWKELSHYFESPDFFHFYFSPKTFFLIPKQNISVEDQHALRGYLNNY